MATDKLKQAGEYIQANKKPLLYIGGAIAIVIVGYAIVSKLKGGISGLFTDKSSSATPFKPLFFDDKKSTISNELANSYANQFYNSMKNIGTNEDTIYSVLQKLQKKEDFIKVYNAFGLKSYTGSLIGGSPTYPERWLGSYDDYDLIEWFRAELSIKNYPTYSLAKKTVNNAGFAF